MDPNTTKDQDDSSSSTNKINQPSTTSNNNDEKEAAITHLRNWLIQTNHTNNNLQTTITTIQTNEPSILTNKLFYHRFLLANNYNLPQTKESIQQHLVWRCHIHYPSTLTQQDVELQIQSNLFQILGTCDNGSVLLLAHHAKLHPNDYTVESYERYIVFMLEEGLRLSSSQQQQQQQQHENQNAKHKFTLLFDLSGFSYTHHISSHALSLGRAMTLVAQSHYPECLYKMIAVNVPTVFSFFWNVIYRFIDDKTKEKIVFVKDTVVELGELICPVTLLPDRLR
mmetsp:Transcript_10315/g.15239  ORF Transcript_10315/g.15239 Transcript_10315/m.15239 type:complete len:282 (+) Transcript_10315:142-987(+)